MSYAGIRAKKKHLVASTTHHDTLYSYNIKPTTVIIKSPDINLAGVNPVKLGKIQLNSSQHQLAQVGP